MEHTKKETWRITGKSEMDGIEIGMDNNDGTICPLITMTWYGEDDCNAEEDEARAKELVRRWNSQPDLLEACEKAFEESHNPKVEKILEAAIEKATRKA